MIDDYLDNGTADFDTVGSLDLVQGPVPDDAGRRCSHHGDAAAVRLSDVTKNLSVAQMEVCAACFQEFGNPQRARTLGPRPAARRSSVASSDHH
ncbi:MAG: hypothetical protein JWM86_2561 [Thermoleophilia bacterium]|nr:hypothetical protein [Thermoleophilia bacterium]